MNYSKIITYDTANSHGFSTTLWVTGCPHKCEGCFNSELWNQNCGKKFTTGIKNKIIESLNQKFINNFVILGGEPLSKEKRNEILQLCKEIKKETPHIQIIIYTGYSIQEIEREYQKELFPYIDYLIDGRYDKDLKPDKLELRGSVNQKCWQIVHFNNKYHINDISNKYFNAGGDNNG